MSSLGNYNHTSICDCKFCNKVYHQFRKTPFYTMAECWDILEKWKTEQPPPLNFKSNRHIFITISLNPKKFKPESIVDWIPDLPCIQNHAIWCFEFFGKNLKFHPHIHLLIKTNKKLDKKRIIKKLSSQFKINENFIDYKTGNNKHLLTKRVNYIKGIKTCIKDACLNADQKYRDEKNIKDFYSL